MSRSEEPDKTILRAGDAVLLIDRKEREYLRTLKPGRQIHVRNGALQADELIGLPEGSIVRNAAREPFLLLRPSYAHLIPNLPRQAQVIYPKDVGPILLWGDIYPGATVIEVGTGPGALTIALLRAVGPGGRVISYEARPDFAATAADNVRRFYGDADNWTVRLQDAFGGFTETGVDRMVVDLAEPWQLLDHAAGALRPGGILVAYVPTVLQVKQQVDAMRAHGGFAAVEVMESLLRFWHVQDRSVRPEHRMVAHTGFILVAHRVQEGAGDDRGRRGDRETEAGREENGTTVLQSRRVRHDS
jgi:tRNA (adenine57-N1/adenine58-N1)-methyltransferase